MRRLAPVLMLLAGCNDFSIAGGDKDDVPPIDTDTPGIGLCSTDLAEHATPAGPGCAEYTIGNFNPFVEFRAILGRSSLALPVVADLDGEMPPEILVNVLPRAPLGFTPGELWAVHGDGDPTPYFKITDAKLGMGAAPAVADLDGDGHVEILGVRSVGPQAPFTPLNKTDYRVVAWDHTGAVELWESEPFRKTDFDYGSTIAVSDMDHDGSPEIVVGRVILNADGTTRGVGRHGRGSWGGTVNQAFAAIGEGSVGAVADLDLDGVEEVIVGDAWYTPDGDDKWYDPNGDDGMIGVANLDDDPYGEVVVTTGGTIRAIDHDGSVLWRRKQLYCLKMPECEQLIDPNDPNPITQIKANIASAPAIDDIDGDGRPEVVVAAGSQVIAFNHDGSQLWAASDVLDITGATGASIFDFDGDGTLEVVYIDEIGMYAFDGVTGAVRFKTNKHASNTMFDYPTIADVDADGSAEIVVAHAFYDSAISVYGAGDGYWAPARRIWNQHAYDIANVNDDGTVPTSGPQGFETYNSWHSAYAPELFTAEDKQDLTAADAAVCEAECDAGFVHVWVQPGNVGPRLVADAGVSVSLYAREGASLTLIATQATPSALDPATVGAPLHFTVDASVAARADALVAVVDDDGAGQGAFEECAEDDNKIVLQGPFCP